MRFYPLMALSLALALTPATAADDKLPPNRPPSKMSSSEIKAHNAGLDDDHPYYIRCSKTQETGSLVKKVRICRTNEQWRAFADRVRDEMGTSMSGGSNTN